MSGLKVYLDRYDGPAMAAVMDSCEAVILESDASMEIPMGDPVGGREFDTIEVLFQLADGKVDSKQLEMARSLILEIGRIDNAVQAKCAEECAESGFHPRNYEGELAFVRMLSDRALLRYWGTGVNTEWDELVLRVGDDWSHRGTVRPGACSS